MAAQPALAPRASPATDAPCLRVAVARALPRVRREPGGRARAVADPERRRGRLRGVDRRGRAAGILAAPLAVVAALVAGRCSPALAAGAARLRERAPRGWVGRRARRRRRSRCWRSRRSRCGSGSRSSPRGSRRRPRGASRSAARASSRTRLPARPRRGSSACRVIGLVAEVHWRLAFLALRSRPRCSPVSPSRAAARRRRSGAGKVASRAPPRCRRAALGAWRAPRERGLGRHARVQRRAPHRGVRAFDDRDRRRARGRRGRVPRWQSAGGRHAAGARAAGMLACSVAAAIGVALTWAFTPRSRSRSSSSPLRRDGRDADRGGNRLRVHGRGRARSRGRHGSGSHDAARVPGRRARRRAALAVGGFAGSGVAFGGLFVASTLPYAAACPGAAVRTPAVARSRRRGSEGSR